MAPGPVETGPTNDTIRFPGVSMSYLPADNRYESMPYRRTGVSGLLLPPVSLGLWHNFGGVDSEENARAMIRYAFDHGITHFDLANNYGPPPGSAEACFGRILATDLAAHRNELVISSKAGYRMWPGPYGEWGSRKYLLSSLDESLDRMGLDYVDIFYSHRFDPNTPLAETMAALATAVHSGKALYVGISSYDAVQTSQATAILADLGVPCLIHQPSYSIFNRWIEDGLLAALDDTGTGCIAFSPLAQGLLTDKYLHGVPADSRAAKHPGQLQQKAVNDANLTAIRGLNELAQARDQSLAQMALAWVLRHPRMTSVIIGASRIGQIEDNLGALAKLDFSAAELDSIDAICARRSARMQ